ncbi:hypothetical protein ABLO27_03620 [Roseibium sp. SCPC15]|uniref:hypothetical protein n=1 Tax=Roseibium sp. SCP15 TaxID=3141376 RepID=UPI003334FBBE
MKTISSELPPAVSNPARQVSTHGKSVEQEFLGFRSALAEQYLAWTELPEEERIRHRYLQDRGLTEANLDNLSPGDRAAHEEKIAELTKQPVFANSPGKGMSAGDALSRPVISLQSVLEISDGTNDADHKP